MNGLVTALAWLLITLTFTGSYRLADTVVPDSDEAAATDKLYPPLIASTLTIAFVLVFEVLILVVGLAAVLLPIVLVFRPSLVPSPDITGRVAAGRTGLRARLAAVRDYLADLTDPGRPPPDLQQTTADYAEDIADQYDDDLLDNEELTTLTADLETETSDELDTDGERTETHENTG